MSIQGKLVKNELHDKIKEIELEHDIKFSNTQKVLSTVEGSITALLDVLYGTVSIFQLDNHFENADEAKAELLDINEGDEINYREVIIFGKGKPMIYACSLIPLSQCESEFRDDILDGSIPIGKILKKHDIESRREINRIYIENPNPTLKELFKTNEYFISRDYVVIHNGQILMHTKESYPISNFKEEM